jgi:hypothetical protein
MFLTSVPCRARANLSIFHPALSKNIILMFCSFFIDEFRGTSLPVVA